jgi:hypothetical protein
MRGLSVLVNPAWYERETVVHKIGSIFVLSFRNDGVSVVKLSFRPEQPWCGCIHLRCASSSVHRLTRKTMRTITRINITVPPPMYMARAPS